MTGGIKPLSSHALLFFAVSPPPPEGQPYKMLPWTNNTWRIASGLLPIENPEDEESSQRLIDQGFQLSETGRQSLSRQSLSLFKASALSSIDHFLNEVAGRARLKSATCLTRINKVTGYNSYRGAMLAMVNRSGGVLDEVAAIMTRANRTPMNAWRDLCDGQMEELPRQAQLPNGKPKVPSSQGYIDTGILGTAVAERLFGACAVTSSSRIVKPQYEPTIRCLLQRAWEKMSRHATAALTKEDDCKANYEQALAAARTNPTASNLRRAARELTNWKDLAKITGEVEGPEFKALEQALAELWKNIGYSIATDGSVKKSKGKKANGNILASEAEMTAAYHHYVELHFREGDDAAAGLLDYLDGSNAMDETADTGVPHASDTEDLGVAKFTQCSVEELVHLLGLSVPRYPYGEPGSTGDDGKPKKPMMTPKWHQLVGTAAMIEGMFTNAVGQPPRPTLLCDDVGLGKTAQIIGTISMLVHLIELQTKQKPMPPLLAKEKKLFFAGKEKIERLPSLIIVPRTLSMQWRQQITLFTEAGAFNVLTYSTQSCDRRTFFGPGGLWEAAVQRSPHPERTILLAEISMILAEAKACLAPHPIGLDEGLALVRGEPLQVSHELGEGSSIFDQRFLLTAVDEIHNLRNPTHAYQGVLRLASNSAVCIGATATPVFTGTKDLSAQGRLLRYGPMIGEEGEELAMYIKKSEQERKKSWRKHGHTLINNVSQNMVEAQNTARGEEEGPPDDEGQHIAASKGLVETESVGYKNLYISQDAIAEARKQLLPIVVRRTGESLKPDGSPLMDLRRYIESTVWTVQREDERELTIKLFERLLDSEGLGGLQLKLVEWKNFLMDHKHAVFLACLLEQKDDPSPSWLEWTAEDLDVKASSRILQLCYLVEHYKDPNAQPLFFKRDGSRDLEKEAEHKGPPAKRPRKVLVFIMYDLHRQIASIALTLKGLKCLEYDGKMSLAARQQAVDRFERDDEVRVMLISNVGTTGLNLTMASVVIFVSGLWSAMETKQTIGRVWRPGQQENRVLVHHILAPNTVDELLAGYANSKDMLSQEFFKQKMLIDKLFRSNEATGSEGDSESEDEEPSARTAPKSRVRSRPIKAAHESKVESSASTTKNASEPKSSRTKDKVSSEKRGESSQGNKKKTQADADRASAPSSQAQANVSAANSQADDGSANRPRKRPRMKGPLVDEVIGSSVADVDEPIADPFPIAQNNNGVSVAQLEGDSWIPGAAGPGANPAAETQEKISNEPPQFELDINELIHLDQMGAANWLDDETNREVAANTPGDEVSARDQLSVKKTVNATKVSPVSRAAVLQPPSALRQFTVLNRGSHSTPAVPPFVGGSSGSCQGLVSSPASQKAGGSLGSRGSQGTSHASSSAGPSRLGQFRPVAASSKSAPPVRPGAVKQTVTGTEVQDRQAQRGLVRARSPPKNRAAISSRAVIPSSSPEFASVKGDLSSSEPKAKKQRQ